MKKYVCGECGDEFSKKELDADMFEDGDYYCHSCAESLAQAGWDAVDADHDYDSYSDWDERGR